MSGGRFADLPPDDPRIIAYRARTRAITELPEGTCRDLLQVIALVCPAEFDDCAVLELRPPTLAGEGEGHQVLIDMLRVIGAPR